MRSVANECSLTDSRHAGPGRLDQGSLHLCPRGGAAGVDHPRRGAGLPRDRQQVAPVVVAVEPSAPSRMSSRTRLGPSLTSTSTAARSHSPAPARMVSSACSCTESSVPSCRTAATPPWAHWVAESSRKPLVTMPTRRPGLELRPRTAGPRGRPPRCRGSEGQARCLAPRRPAPPPRGGALHPTPAVLAGRPNPATLSSVVPRQVRPSSTASAGTWRFHW